MRLPPLDLFIDNKWVSAGGDKIVSLDPSDGSVIAEVSAAGEAEVDAAVGAARRALDGEWRDVMPSERGRILRRIADGVRARFDEFVDVEVHDAGKPLAHARATVEGCIGYFTYHAGLADKIEGRHLPLGPGYLGYTVREPLGVTAHIIPWNVPISMMARGIAPALAAGCTAVVKPAEQTPIGALQLAEVIIEAGVPPGVVNVVNGVGEVAGALLARHPGIDGITFTGSVETGKDILRAAADHVRPVVLELGGKSPVLVFADSDLELAAEEACKVYKNAGQFCDAGSRLLVSSKCREELMGRILERTRKVRVGRAQEDPDMGPLITGEQMERVLGYIRVGEEEGCEVLAGGGRPDGLDDGFFVAPTVFDGVRPGMRIAQEEIFGPVLSVIPFDDEEEGIEIANGTAYGLAAGIFTKDIDRALRIASRIRAGSVWINEYWGPGEVSVPFGGYKSSGIGRENGQETINNYTQTKSVTVRIRAD